MTVLNRSTAGDHIGSIRFKNMKKGLYIEESTFLHKKQTFINKQTVDAYEVVMDDSEAVTKGSLAKGVVGAATFGLAGAIVGGNSKKTKTKHRRLVSITFKDGTRALCELDDEYYEILFKLMY